MRRNSKDMAHIPVTQSIIDLVDEHFKEGDETRLDTFERVAKAAKVAAAAGIRPDAPTEHVSAAYIRKHDLEIITFAAASAKNPRPLQGDALVMGVMMAVEAKKRGLV